MFSAIMTAILGTIGIVVGAVEGEKANQQNKDLVAANNKSNQDIQSSINETNIQLAHETMRHNSYEAEKAYQRSTQKNQIRELIAAGYTEQQAKMIVAGSGSAASYTPATATAPTVGAALNEAAQVTNPLGSASEFGAQMAELGKSFGSIGDDLTAPDGGSLGKIAAQPMVRECFQHMDDIDPEALSSIQSFTKWYNSNLDKDWVKDSKDKFDKVMRSPQASRAFMSQLKDFANSYSDTQIMKTREVEMQQKNLELAIANLRKTLTEGEIDQQAIETELKRYDLKIAPYNYNTVVAELSNRFEVASLNQEYLTNDEYRKNFVQNTIKEEKYRQVYLACQILHENLQQMSLEQQEQYMKQHAAMFAIYGLFRDFGMTTTDVGSAVAALTAGAVDMGFDFNKWLRTFVYNGSSDDSSHSPRVHTKAGLTLEDLGLVGPDGEIRWVSNDELNKRIVKFFKGTSDNGSERSY